MYIEKAFAIRRVSLEEIEALSEISISTFKETFEADNDPIDMALYLNKQLNQDTLKVEYEDPYSEFYFLTDSKGDKLGYLKVNKEKSPAEIRDKTAFEIERIYILKQYHGQNLGNILMDKAIEIATQNQANYIWLGVWEKNYRAVAFYKKYGFEVFGDHIFQFGNDAQTDLLMRKFIRH